MQSTIHRNISEAQNREIKFIYTDLDGSFAVEGKVPRENVEQMERFLNSHPERKAAISSGRGPISVMSVLRDAGLEDYVLEGKLHISGYNSALIYLGDKIIHNRPFSTKSSEMMQIAAYDKGIDAVFFGKNMLFQGKKNDYTEWYTKFLDVPLESGYINLSEDMYLAEFIKPAGLSRDGLRSTLGIPEHDNEIFTYFFVTPFRSVDPNTVVMQAHPKGIDKSLGVNHYMDVLRLKPEEILVAGDAPNDIASLNVPGVTAIVFESKYNDEILPQIKNPETYLAGNPDNGAWKDIADNVIRY